MCKDDQPFLSYVDDALEILDRATTTLYSGLATSNNTEKKLNDALEEYFLAGFELDRALLRTNYLTATTMSHDVVRLACFLDIPNPTFNFTASTFNASQIKDQRALIKALIPYTQNMLRKLKAVCDTLTKCANN